MFNFDEIRNSIINDDCLNIMRDIPDKYFELAIVDPPYNVGASDGNFGRGPKGGYRKDLKHYANHNITPDKKYFDELFRISQNQIIWGSNYYPEFLKHNGAIVWIKKDYNFGILSDAEIAYNSNNKMVQIFRYNWSGFNKGNNSKDEKVSIIHPNQKPVALYRWLLINYAKPGDKIIDTHSGSGSCAIACLLEKHDFLAIEKDVDYWKASVERYETEISQGKLF